MVIKDLIGKKTSSAKDVAEVLSHILKSGDKLDRDKEHFWVIGLNTRNSIKFVELVSLGTLNASLIHPREVFRYSVMHGVCSIIIGHNHPSGNPEPSETDIETTKRLVNAGKILGIEILDHVIIGGNGSLQSLKERGEI
jgi:DNA repair protein RadC